ncbi:coniferyl aldehyde dehydrogenase [Facilibium subflavum]|uniref:coniferyl aldehyde dehydrogenase n=1 Tax=Facilibium subflavum TaxID=2219058 RepID=UPI000E6493D9|nr:coniferyl aldehyde dehydrogenase [Facilibium subflavum]
MSQHLFNELYKTFERQKNAFSSMPYPSYKKRIQDLKRLRELVLQYQGALAKAVSEDFGGRCVEETLLSEIFQVIQTIDYVCKHLRGWMKKQKRHTSILFQPAKSFVYYQPLGVVGIISPWNYPVLLTLSPLVYALASGNNVCLKISEYTPKTFQVIKEICKRCFEVSQVAVFIGDTLFSKAFCEVNFDHLLFTGSTQTGKKVYQAASQNLTPVTLELGGKSPLIIDRDYPVKKAAKTICFSKGMNAGQTCIAPDYVLVPEDKLDELISALQAGFNKMYPDYLNNPQYTSILQVSHFQRLNDQLSQAKTSGCKVIPLAKIEKQTDGNKKMPLTLVINPDISLDVMQGEIFGPILPILTYHEYHDALSTINKNTNPLALYLLSHNKATQAFFLENTQSGGVCINDAIVHIAQHALPFGGVGDSGMGRYHAKEGFITFSNIKSIFQRKKWNPAALLYPPYGKLFKGFKRLFIR